MRSSIGLVYSWKSWKYFSWADPDLAGPFYQMIGRTMLPLVFHGNDFSEASQAAQIYLDHNEKVKKLTPKERLLVFRLGESGWKDLCGFLGHGVPEGVEYPRMNESRHFVGFHTAFVARATVLAVERVLAVAVPMGAVIGGAVWYWQRMRRS
jgi:Sulfotransferase domain